MTDNNDIFYFTLLKTFFDSGRENIRSQIESNPR